MQSLRHLLLGLLLTLFTSFHTFGEPAAPGAGGDPAPSGERISTEGMVDMEDGALSGVLQRLNLDPDAFGVTSGTPAKGAEGKDANDGQDGKAAASPAAKKKEEEEAAARAKAAGAAGGDGKDGEPTVDLAALNLNETQVAAVEKALADGVDLTAFTPAELEEFGFTGEQILKFEELVKGAAAAGNEGATELDRIGLTPEQKAAVEKLLPKDVVKVEEFQKVQTDLTQAQAENNRLAKELAGKTPGVAVAAMHPVFMLNDEAKLNERERQLATFEQWALKNFDGVEAKEAAGDQPAQPAYTAAEVRERYAQVQNERQVLIPRARELLANVRQADQAALAAYPALKDSKSEESLLVANILQRAPGLAALFPNVRMILMDAAEGEKARLKRTAGAGGAKGDKGLKLVLGKAGGKTAPKLPMGAKPGRAAAAGGVSRTQRSDTIDERKFVEMGSSRDALVHLIGQTNLVGS